MDVYDIWKLIIMQVVILYIAFQLAVDNFVNKQDEED